MLSHHIVEFLGSRWMETAPTSIEVLLRPALVQSDKPSDLRGFLSPTTRHRCKHVLVYTAPGSPRRSPIQLWTSPALLNFSDGDNTDELTPYSVHIALTVRTLISTAADIQCFYYQQYNP